MDRRVAVAGLVAFVALVLVEHALEPQLGPGRHTISEYVNSGSGVLMTSAFVAWAVSLLAAAVLVWRAAPRARRWAAVVIAVMLAVAAAGMALTARFATQTSAGVLPAGVERTTAGQIHDLASGAAQEALLVAVVASLVAFWSWTGFRTLTACLLAVALVSAAALLAIGDPVDGIRQRVLVAAGCVWQAALIVTASRCLDAPRTRCRAGPPIGVSPRGDAGT